MPAIKSIQEIAEKWGRVTPGRAVDYKNGVERPRRDWADATEAASETYAQAITDAIANNRFATGVRRAGTRKWQSKTLEKGPSRWGQGVRMAEPDYRDGFSPYRDLIEQIVLPARGPVNSPENWERSRIIGEALHALKLQLG